MLSSDVLVQGDHGVIGLKECPKVIREGHQEVSLLVGGFSSIHLMAECVSLPVRRSFEDVSSVERTLDQLSEVAFDYSHSLDTALDKGTNFKRQQLPRGYLRLQAADAVAFDNFNLMRIGADTVLCSC